MEYRLRKNGGLKIVSNKDIVKICLEDGWVLDGANEIVSECREEIVEVQKKRGRPKAVKDDNGA